MKAMILSAGFGTRLQNYTKDLPKALVPYKGIPMIAYQIERLKKLGVNEVIVNTHHHPDKIKEYFNRNNFGVKISLIFEPEILGTGGGILNAGKYFTDEDFFLVMNVDIETDMDLNEMINFHKKQNPFATLAVQKRQTKKYLEFDDEMHLKGRASDDTLEKNKYAFNGIHIISKRIFEKGFKIKFEDILELYFQIIKNKNEFISGYDAGECTFKDLGKIENLLS